MMRRTSLLVALTAVMALGTTGFARADVTLGTTDITGVDSGSECAGDVIAQATSDPSTPYNVPGPGTINRWQIYSGPPSTPGSSITFVVLRGTTVVGSNTQTIPNPAPTTATYSIPTPIAVTGGETLGLWEQSGDVICYVLGGSVPPANTLMALTSVSTPTAGQTLAFANVNSPPGYRMNLSANFVPTPPKKKKCKKKKKHKSSAELAKKKCKKKKK